MYCHSIINYAYVRTYVSYFIYLFIYLFIYSFIYLFINLFQISKVGGLTKARAIRDLGKRETD